MKPLPHLAPLVLLLTGPVALHAQGGGPLDPPGPPSDGVYRTAEEIEPRVPISEAGFVITEAGSYFLTKNLEGGAGEHGIEIQASGVTLDLRGFSLEGVPGSLSGIVITGAQSDIVIRNGRILNWVGLGLEGSSGRRVVAEKLHVISCSGGGIRLGEVGTVAHCPVAQSGGYGIRVANGSIVKSCVVEGHATGGIRVDGGGSITDCRALANGEGILGINATVTHCVAIENTIGFVLGGCVVEGCRERDSLDVGFDVVSDNLVRNCSSMNAVVDGFRVRNSRNRIEGNLVTGTTFSVPSVGFNVSNDRNLIIGNSVRGAVTGFSIVAGNRVGPILVDPALGPNSFSNFDF